MPVCSNRIRWAWFRGLLQPKRTVLFERAFRRPSGRTRRVASSRSAQMILATRTMSSRRSLSAPSRAWRSSGLFAYCKLNFEFYKFLNLQLVKPLIFSKLTRESPTAVADHPVYLCQGEWVLAKHLALQRCVASEQLTSKTSIQGIRLSNSSSWKILQVLI